MSLASQFSSRRLARTQARLPSNSKGELKGRVCALIDRDDDFERRVRVLVDEYEAAPSNGLAREPLAAGHGRPPLPPPQIMIADAEVPPSQQVVTDLSAPASDATTVKLEMKSEAAAPRRSSSRGARGGWPDSRCDREDSTRWLQDGSYSFSHLCIEVAYVACKFIMNSQEDKKPWCFTYTTSAVFQLGTV